MATKECRLYEERFIAFIDILGFGSLVEESGENVGLAESIFEALSSLHPNNIEKTAYGTINYENIPQEEVEAVEFIHARMLEAMKIAHPLTLTYFSDCLVISAPATSVVASQLVLDVIAKLSILLWVKHSLVIRGGVTKGLLVHVENGPLFGPAMNCAYYLESKKAKFPRVIIDEVCLSAYRQVETFGLFESLLEKAEDFSYLNLATSFRHTIEDSTLALSGGVALKNHEEWFSNAPEKISKIEQQHQNESVKEKYSWLLAEFKKILELQP